MVLQLTGVHPQHFCISASRAAIWLLIMEDILGKFHEIVAVWALIVTSSHLLDVTGGTGWKQFTFLVREMSCAPPHGSAFALIWLLPTAADLPVCLPYVLLVDFIWHGLSPLAMSPAQPCHELLVRAFPRLQPEPLSYTTRCSLWCSYLMCWEARALFSFF